MPLTNITDEQILAVWTGYTSAINLVSIALTECTKHANALLPSPFPSPDDPGLTKLEWDLFTVDLEALAVRCVDLAKCTALVRELIKAERKAIDAAAAGPVH